jgi:molybdopterin/thiamine biosynthesis adenylyltransferase
VGAGGTGGRVIPPLMQILRRGDDVAIVDGDHVEDRNLARQNFRQRDIGENKAEVMARRYRREGISCDVFATMLNSENWKSIWGTGSGLTPAPTGRKTIILGCVDNPAARQIMAAMVTNGDTIWIDGGNERRGGQVILTANHWPFKVKHMRTVNGVEGLHVYTGNYRISGISAMPQLLMQQAWHCDRCNVDNTAGARTCSSCTQPEDSCRDRIDLQTVAVNQLSATCILNILSCILYQVPFSTCGAFFSTLNTMSPIKLTTVNWSEGVILPEMTYANTSAE